MMQKIQEKVLNDLMSFLDEEDSKSLKKHPKIMAAKISLKDEGKEPMTEKLAESPECESEEEGMDIDSMSPDELKAMLKEMMG